MKKILILANHAVTIDLFRRELIEDLIKRGFEVYISLPYEKSMQYYVDLGCNIIDTPVDRRGTNIKNDLKLITRYLKITRDINPDIVLTYTVKPNLYGGIVCKMRKIPYIPNVTGLGSGFMNTGIIQTIIKILSKVSYTSAVKVMVQNSNDLDLLKSYKMIGNNYKLIPGSGVNLEKYKLLEYPKNQENIHFNFIGRVMKEKGIDEYIEAAKLIKEKYSNVTFNVIGMLDQIEYKDILKDYHNKGIITYHGFQKDISKFIKMGSCTINPSYSEGMSNVLLESSASGRCIIASNIPGCREIVDENITGYTFEVKNVNDLCSKIEQFINLTYKEKVNMGINGRLKVEAEFDRNIVIDSYIEEINRVI